MIPVNVPAFLGNEKKYLNECIDTGWISSEGPFVKRFENEVSKYVNRKYATACSSGTAALDIAAAAIGLKEGDEVIIPSFTIISCATAFIKLGIKPIFVDCNIETFNVDPSVISSKITSKTKAILIVHIYGLTVDLYPILEIAKKNNLRVIEDAAEMYGQEYKEKKCGSFGDISIFSFYPNKQITTGEGGMVLTNDPSLDERAKSLRNLCFTKDRFIHQEIGYNYRMTNLQAAIGVAQHERIDEIVKRKREIGNYYNNLLKNIENINLPIKKTDYCENIYWVYPIVLKKNYSKNAKQIMQELGNFKIGTRPFFYPMHKQPIFQKLQLIFEGNFSNSEYLYEKGFYIPSGLAITEKEMKEVARCLKLVLNN